MAETASNRQSSPRRDATAVLVLADGTVFWGEAAGATATESGSALATGEVCFNTSMTGYQEILTDPSYAGQMITFTFPHIGNIGTNPEDEESGPTDSNEPPTAPFAARGFILRESITDPANFRSVRHFSDWAAAKGIVGITGVDTRRLTRHIRLHGAPSGVIAHSPDGRFDIAALVRQAADWPGLEGMDLAKDVSTDSPYEWAETRWELGRGFGAVEKARFHVVAFDYGIKRNILRCLGSVGCRVTVVPCTAKAEDVLALNPDGIFLSNGPGDPAATGEYAIAELQTLIASGKPIFGICLGHQLLALALGGKTSKMHQGHRGANHPVKDLETGKVEITSMNHGFTVDDDGLPGDIVVTHRSLFDGTITGLKVKNGPIFSVQYHPEASPGPQDSHYLFERFVRIMETQSA